MKFCDAYSKELQSKANQVVKKPLGRPLLLGDIDEDVQKYIKQIRLCGGVINTAVVEYSC